ncbi:MAG: amidohydrolase family protein [Candidatus Binatia bacterium]|nr:amidohydrolase family protein [Candidatus Binatia bacterium]
MIQHLADADGHVIEPGDLWVERLPKNLRENAPHFYRDDDGVFHQRIYGLDIGDLDTIFQQIKPSDMLQNMGLAAAMGIDLGPVFNNDDAGRFTILDAPDWSKDGGRRLAFNTEHGLTRAVLYPTFMLAGGTFTPDLAPAVCEVYNDWILNDYCSGSAGRLIPVAALPIVDPEASVHEIHRTAALGFHAAFIRTNPVNHNKYSEREFDVVWQALVDTEMKLGLHPLPVWDQDGAARGFRLKDIMASSALGFPMDMIATLYDMMSGGIFDRFPNLQTMILEAGAGWIPSFFERFEDHRRLFGRFKAPDWKTPPMEIFERQMMVTVEACEHTDLKIALDFLPADHVALASDWPHYDGTPDLVEGFQKAGLGLPQTKLREVATGTLDRWFPES